MAIHVEFTAPIRIDVHVTGLMLRAEVDAAKYQIHDMMQALVRWDDIDVDHSIKQHIVRMAVVGDLRWRDSALLYLFNSMVPFQIEYFPAVQKPLADAWLTH